MPCCAVKACVNYDKKHKKRDGFTFHRFPTDPVRHEAWSRVIRNERGEPYYKPNGNSRICSEHFREDDFYFPGSRRMLKKNAIPSVKVQPFKFYMEEKETLIVKMEPHESDDSQDHLNDSVKVKVEADASGHPHDGLNDLLIVKIESHSSDKTQSDFNDLVTVKIEPHASDDLNGPVMVKIRTDAPDNNSQNVLNDSVQVNIEDDAEDGLEDVDISDLEPIYETPLEAALKQKIDKYTSIIEIKTKKIKVLQRQNNRLMERNKSLMKIIKELNSKGLISTDIKSALGDTPELAIIYKLLDK